MDRRNIINGFDSMFDFDNDGEIDMLEQYAEIDFISSASGGLHIEDAAYDYLMHSDNPDIGIALGLTDYEDPDADQDDLFDDEDYDS